MNKIIKGNKNEMLLYSHIALFKDGLFQEFLPNRYKTYLNEKLNFNKYDIIDLESGGMVNGYKLYEYDVYGKIGCYDKNHNQIFVAESVSDFEGKYQKNTFYDFPHLSESRELLRSLNPLNENHKRMKEKGLFGHYVSEIIELGDNLQETSANSVTFPLSLLNDKIFPFGVSSIVKTMVTHECKFVSIVDCFIEYESDKKINGNTFVRDETLIIVVPTFASKVQIVQ